MSDRRRWRRRGTGAVNRASAFLSKALIFRPDNAFAVGAFEPANGKMTFSHVLEMLDERVVHRGTAERTDDRERLSGDLLRHHDAKAGRHLHDEANENWAAFLDEAALGDESCGFRHALRQHTADGEISALRSIVRARPSAQ